MTGPIRPKGPTPADTLRDARLAHALHHMPDAHMQPSAQTRSAVLHEAARVVGSPAQPTLTPMPQRRWWHAWLGQPGHRVPWGAAVASLAVFGFITVMWYGQEVPDAAPERSAVVAHKADGGAEAQAEAQADATAKPSDRKRAEPDAPQARAPAAARVAAPAPAPAAPPVADAVAVAAAPAAPAAPVAAPAAVAAPRAPATANAAMEADAPVAQARLERRSKAMQSEEATADRSQARESGALAARAGAAPPVAPAPAAGVGAASAVPTAPAKARSAAPAVWVLTLGDVQHSLRPEQAQKLVVQLRALPYSAVTEPSQSADGSGDAIRLESAGQERWVIAPGYVTHYVTHSLSGGVVSAAGAAAQRSAITPAQYAQLRRLAMELGAEPSHLSAP